MNWRSLEARVGQLIRPKWKALLAWAQSQRFVPGPGILYRQTPDGILIWGKSRKRWPHAWKVREGVDGFEISVGMVNGMVAAIGDRTLEGKRWKKEEPGKDIEIPLLPYDPPKQGDGQRWIVLRMPNRMEPAQVAQAEAPDKDGDHALALVSYVGGKVASVRQIARHHYTAWDAGGTVLFLAA